MIIFPAIDLVGGQAVRLFKGDYAQMTVYHPDPLTPAKAFEQAGATWVHVVDLEGARDGGTPNFDAICRIIRETGLQVEVGGGIRDMAVIDKYLTAGAARVVLGTAAVTDKAFVADALKTYGSQIALGADVKDGQVAIRGWKDLSGLSLTDFCRKFGDMGAQTLICTDISRDGVMMGANRALYADLQRECRMNIVASGGVSAMEDVIALRDMGLYGAIIGKAYYTGAIDLQRAIKEAMA